VTALFNSQNSDLTIAQLADFMLHVFAYGNFTFICIVFYVFLVVCRVFPAYLSICLRACSWNKSIDW